MNSKFWPAQGDLSRRRTPSDGLPRPRGYGRAYGGVLAFLLTWGGHVALAVR